MESTVTVRGSCAKNVQCDPPLFFCPRQAFIVFDLQEICWLNVAGRCRTPIAAHIVCARSVETCNWAALDAEDLRCKSAAEWP